MDAAWKVTRRGWLQELTPAEQNALREFIASKIIDDAAKGETDPARMVSRAMNAVFALRRRRLVCVACADVAFESLAKTE